MAVNFNKPTEIRDFRNGSWFWTQTHVWRDKRLSKSDKVTYATLASYANNGQDLYPSITTIAIDADLSERQTYTSIRNLEKFGYISIKRNTGHSNTYTLLKTYPAPEDQKRPHPTPAMIAPLQNNTVPPAKNGVGTPAKSLSRTTSSRTISINNSDEVKKLTARILKWAYERAKVTPSIPVDSYEKSVLSAIERFGVDRVYKMFENEVNAITFLVNIKG